MRFALLLILASSCTTAGDHVASGTYDTNYDGVIVDDGIGASVVEVKVDNQDGSPVQDLFFHSDSVDGSFTFTVPDGSVNVLVWFDSKTADGKDQHAEYEIDGPVENDVDMGYVELF
jgi:hypothetical protein